MPYLEKYLVIKHSQLPGAGKGLFTRVDIVKGQRIVEYKGKIVKWKEVKQLDGYNGYLMFMNRNHVINAEPTIQFKGRYANDALGFVRIPGLTNNAEYVEDGLKVYIQAVKDIPAGSEILVEYGKEYWDAIRYNIKLEQERKRMTGKRKETPES